jgi:hypothetical protein
MAVSFRQKFLDLHPAVMGKTFAIDGSARGKEAAVGKSERCSLPASNDKISRLVGAFTLGGFREGETLAIATRRASYFLKFYFKLMVKEH